MISFPEIISDISLKKMPHLFFSWETNKSVIQFESANVMQKVIVLEEAFSYQLSSDITYLQTTFTSVNSISVAWRFKLTSLYLYKYGCNDYIYCNNMYTYYLINTTYYNYINIYFTMYTMCKQVDCVDALFARHFCSAL